MPVEGWFSTPGRTGDRTLAQQLLGLDALIANCRGRTVLDIGAAEGLISIELAKAGATAVHGIEIVPGHVEVANRLRGDLPVMFEVADANTWQPKREYDIVLMLAVLHKLREPEEACARFAACCRDLCVIRLPPAGAPVIVDARSGNRPFDIGATMGQSGFELERVEEGSYGEWIGFYRRLN